jgi:hypothetical protein
LILNAKHTYTIYISSSLYWSIVKLPKIFEKAAISPQKTIFLCLQHIKFTRLFRSELSPRGLWRGSNMIINHLSLSVDELPVQTTYKREKGNKEKKNTVTEIFFFLFAHFTNSINNQCSGMNFSVVYLPRKKTERNERKTNLVWYTD